MARTVNFVRERQKKLSKAEQLDKQVMNWAIWGFVFVFVAFLIAFGVKLYFSTQLKNIVADQEQTKAAILAEEDIESSYIVFANKLTKLTELFGKRKDKQEALVYFSNLFGPDVIIAQLEYSSDVEVVTFVLRSLNVFVLDTVFQTLDSPEVRQDYPQVIKDGLRRRSSGAYDMQLTIPLSSSPLDQINQDDTGIEDEI